VGFETVYAERTRLAHAAPDPRTDADRAFIAWLLRGLFHGDEERLRDFVSAIVDHYVHEIEGHFDSHVYDVATRVVPAGLSLLLSGFTLPLRRALEDGDRIRVEGDVDGLRALTRAGVPDGWSYPRRDREARCLQWTKRSPLAGIAPSRSCSNGGRDVDGQTNSGADRFQ
jgi:hypothetical protein